MRWWQIRKRNADLERELQSDLELEEEEQRENGLAPEEARYAARRAFGNPTLIREQTQTVWSWNRWETLGRELRIGFRTLMRSPGFSFIALLVMALCIGACTSLFTIVRSVLLRPLPFRDPGHLVMIRDCFRASDTSNTISACGAVSPGDYRDWRDRTHGFEDMASWQWWSFNLTGEHGELPEAVTAAGATWNFFSVLGVQPAFGRAFTEAEDNLDGNTLMLTWTVFARRFGADPHIIGRQIHLDGKPYTVVGVLPASFTYPDARVQVWVPYLSVTPAHAVHQHARHMTYVVARTRADVPLASAIAQVSALQHTLYLQHPTEAVSDTVAPESLLDDLGRDVKKPLTLLMSAVLCMLLIGCLNIANLLVARSAARARDIALRSALGAQRSTLMREQLIETALVCSGGGGVGIFLSLAMTEWMIRSWKHLPSAERIHTDLPVLGVASLLVVLAALAAGLLPAITSTGKVVLDRLQANSRGAAGSVSRSALRKGLLCIEMTVTMVLLVAAGLLLKSYVNLRGTNLGCITENVLTMTYSLPKERYDIPQKKIAFYEALLERVRGIPGVRAAALGGPVPGAGLREDDVFTIEGRPVPIGKEDRSRALIRQADPGYFTALGIPLMSGRFFTAQDRLDHGVKVIVSSALARESFPGENPIGRHLAIPLWSNEPYEIVGVVGDTLYRVNQPTMPAIYFPLLAGGGFTEEMLAVRTTADPLAMSVPIQKEFAALDPQLPVSDVMTTEQIVGESLGDISFTATLVLAFAGLALLLAAVGLYGVLSYLATQRTSELGIRIALGARRGHVLRFMLFDGLQPALFGVGLGLMVSAVVTRILQSMVYGTKALDGAIFAEVTAILLLIAALACIVPAWRASRLDPMKALRTE
ncbi:MAG TPA: ABC transporter permease [Terriglobales bacterium]|nr:ABC transporter permease [Terriglobales bacterium]